MSATTAPPLTEALLQKLWDRGLLVERTAARARLSNNVHGNDRKFLLEIFEHLDLQAFHPAFRTRAGCATAELEQALASRFGAAAELQAALEPLLFEPRHYQTERIGLDPSTWDWFAARRHGPKLEARCLDADLAAVIKTFNAIGAATSYHCAGFTRHVRWPQVVFASGWAGQWARAALCAHGVDAIWRCAGGDGLQLGVRSADEVREVSLVAARNLYADRVRLRACRQRLIIECVFESPRMFFASAMELLLQDPSPQLSLLEDNEDALPALREDHLAWTERV